MTVPLPGPLHSHRDKLGELADLGYTDIWSAESDGADAFTPLALAAAWEPRLRLGTAIVPAFTRSPACFAQCVASLADAAPGPVRDRHRLEQQRDRRALERRAVRRAVQEGARRRAVPARRVRPARRCSKAYDTFEVQGFRLGVRPEQQPPILVAALREGMLRLAGREADGAIINWLSPNDVPKVAGVVNDAAGGDEKEIVCRIFVCPSENAEVVRAAGRYAIAAYLNVPVYAAFHDWLGRGDAAAADVGCLEGGRPQGGAGGDPGRAGRRADRARLARRLPGDDPAYFDNGVTTTSLAILPLDPDLKHWDAVRSLAPSA